MSSLQHNHFRIFPLGIGALTIEFGNSISPALNARALSFSRILESAGLAGFIESVPAYASVTVIYDVAAVRQAFPFSVSVFDAVKEMIIELADRNDEPPADSREFVIGAKFGDENGPDLVEVAKRSGMSVRSVVEIFTATEYRVFMLGFLPGFAYLGEVDERIAMPRKDTPRVFVPQGSIGIAGRQTGIYPTDSPGGWQLIGRTDFSVFDPALSPPTILRPGDRVSFFQI